MRRFFPLMIIFTILIFTGCGRHKLKKATVYVPQLNKVSTAEIGQNMFTKTYAYFKHEKYAKLINIEDRKKYETRDEGNPFDELEGTKCALYNGLKSLLDYNCDGYFTHLRYGKKLDKPVKYKIIAGKPLKESRDSFRYSVLYQGKTANKLKIAFNEFSGSFIRPAFTQVIDYELDSNGEAIIGFKGLRIKVLKATNLDITYQVINDFN